MGERGRGTAPPYGGQPSPAATGHRPPRHVRRRLGPPPTPTPPPPQRLAHTCGSSNAAQRRDPMTTVRHVIESLRTPMWLLAAAIVACAVAVAAVSGSWRAGVLVLSCLLAAAS